MSMSALCNSCSVHSLGSTPRLHPVAAAKAQRKVSSEAGPADAGAEMLDTQVDGVLAATRSLVAIAAQSLAPVDDVVTLSQWRVLVVVSEAQSATLNQVAAGLGVHASTATRICDRLTSTGLLSRREDPTDRRYVSLTLTRKGQRLVDRVMSHRRAAIASVLEGMDPRGRERAAEAFGHFARLAGAPAADPVWGAMEARG